MRPYGSKRSFDTEPRIKSARALVKREGEELAAEQLSSSTACQHPRVTSEVCDQTLGVSCLECHALLAFCWMDDHIPESLWNRACENDEDARPCEQNRDDHCALCGEPMPKKSEGHMSDDDLGYGEDCQECTYEGEQVVKQCQACKEFVQRALDFLISAKLLKKAHEGSA